MWHLYLAIGVLCAAALGIHYAITHDDQHDIPLIGVAIVSIIVIFLWLPALIAIIIGTLLKSDPS